MPEPCTLPSLDGCQKRFLWSHNEAVFAPHRVIGLELQIGDAEKIFQALGFKSLDPFFSRVSKQVPSFASVDEDGGDKRSV